MTRLLLAAGVLSGYNAAGAQGEFGPAPANLPDQVVIMKPSSVPRASLLVRDDCYFYRDRHGDIQPFDFASRTRGIPFCTGAAEPTSSIPLPTPPSPGD